MTVKMPEYEAIEYENILCESRKINELLKKGELLRCKRVSSKKLYNVYQLLVKKDLENLVEENVESFIEKSSVLIFDLRGKDEILRSGFMINNSVECNDSFEKVKSAFNALNKDVISQKDRKNVILYDENGSISENEEDTEISIKKKDLGLHGSLYQNEIKYYFKKCIKLVKNIYILKGGFRDFYDEFPFLCCPVSKSEDAKFMPISKYKSPKDIPDYLKSRIIASIEYPIVISWGQNFKIYLANIVQGCHPYILKTLNIKTVFDLTPNKIENSSKGDDIKFIHIKRSKSDSKYNKCCDTVNDKQAENIPLLEETINALKELENISNYEEIFPLAIVSTNITNDIVSISAVIVSHLRRWKITSTLVFLLGQLCLDNHLITPTENKDIYNKIHPTNQQITNMLSFEF
ncbi:dual specificity phosphatase [Cryptosporidium ryanae]|uniref:dual specificity phosphatase n=1 Tax=Cryptosporidium ryanae TaxID=515981 RepID=UPI00351A5A7B|nr:dual specificity phosphatase [Cryptosporidium ryanae]